MIKRTSVNRSIQSVLHCSNPSCTVGTVAVGTVASIANVATVCSTFREASLKPSKNKITEVNFITSKNKTEVIRFKVSADEKEKIEHAAKKRGLTVSEYLRQAVSEKSDIIRGSDWHETVARLEEICANSDSETREKLIALIRSLYHRGT